MSTPLQNIRREQGSAIALAMLILFMISAIILFISTSTMGSLFQAKRKTERTTGMAAADSGIETIRVALNAHLMDESDGYSLNEADLNKLVTDRGGVVLANANSSDKWGMTKALVPEEDSFTVREVADRGYSFWQVYQVHEPRYNSAEPNNLIVYIRAWATQKREIDDGGTNMATSPRIFRVEYRPGYFSDYQMITDGPFFSQGSNDKWTINGPTHTNGFEGDEWITEGKRGYDMQGPTSCSGRARLTASQDAPIARIGKCNDFRGSSKARQISMLNVERTLLYMRERCGVPHGVRCFVSNNPFKKSYNVEVSNQGVRVDGQMVPLEQNARCKLPNTTDCGDELMAAILVDADINLSGSVKKRNDKKAVRITVATMRKDTYNAASRVWIEPARGLVGAENPDVDTVGVISQGDIILGIRPFQCGSEINIAGIAQSGSITMPRELVTVAQPNVPMIASYVCPNLSITGAFAAHGSLITNMSWNQLPMITNAGYQRSNFTYAKGLYDNPPPFSTLSYPWAMTKVKDADKRCFEGEEVSRPRCE